MRFDSRRGGSGGARRAARTLTERIANSNEDGRRAGPWIQDTAARTSPGFLGPGRDLTISARDRRARRIAVRRPLRVAESPADAVHRDRQFPDDSLDARLLLPATSRCRLYFETAETNIHGFATSSEHTPRSSRALRWKIKQALPPHTIAGSSSKATVHNVLGFKDGTANLDGGDEKLMNEIVGSSRTPANPPGRRGTYQVMHHSDVRRAVGSHGPGRQRQIVRPGKSGDAQLTYAE